MLRSMEVPARLRTSGNEEDNVQFRRPRKAPEDSSLLSSQELFHFKHKGKTDRCESANFGEHMTFGEVNRKQMMTSR
jgi:hypothetical protein